MKKCKNCKEGFTPVNFNQKYCFEKECVQIWVKSEQDKQWVKKKKEMKENLQTVQELQKLAQVYFNSFIRNRDRNLGCISCGSPLGKKFDAGHYFSSFGHKIITYDESNVHGQCVYCNQYLHGNLLNYQMGIQKRIGIEKLIELQAKAHQEKKYTREELKEIIETYKQKTKQYEI